MVQGAVDRTARVAGAEHAVAEVFLAQKKSCSWSGEAELDQPGAAEDVSERDAFYSPDHGIPQSAGQMTIE